MNIPDISSWGPAKYGWRVESNFTYLGDDIVSLDIENAPDGGFVGVGIGHPQAKCVVYYDTLVGFKVPTQFIAHNGKYDLKLLNEWGVRANIENLVADTMIMSYVDDAQRESHGLKELASKLLNIHYPAFDELLAFYGVKDIREIPEDVLMAYNAMDCICTCLLYQYFCSVIYKDPAKAKYLNEIEMPVYRLLYKMEMKGVMLNVDYLQLLDTRFKNESDILRAKLLQAYRSELRVQPERRGKRGQLLKPKALPELSLESPKQVKELLLVGNGIQVDSTKKEALLELERIPLISDLLSYREVQKLQSTYTEPLLHLSTLPRVHCQFNQVGYDNNGDIGRGIRTGRLSSSNPNLQNIPGRTENGGELRRVFIPSRGRLLFVQDLSQIELRVAAHVSGDEALTTAFMKGEDLHARSAKYVQKVFPHYSDKEARKVAKTFNFLLVYGGGAWNMAFKLKIPIEEAERLYDVFHKLYAGFYCWRDRTIAESAKSGYIYSIEGVKLRIQSVDEVYNEIKDSPKYKHLSHDKLMAKAEKYRNNRTISIKIQGGAAIIMKKAALALDKAGFNLELIVHDEFICDELDTRHNDSKLAEMRSIIEGVYKLNVPLLSEGGYGTNWAEAK